MGYRDASTGELTFAFDFAHYDAAAWDAVWLTDYVTGTNVPIAAKDLNGSLATPPQATITYSVNNAPSRGPRRVISSGDEDLRPADPKDPYLTPIGDALIPLLLMMMAYAISILLRRRKSRV